MSIYADFRDWQSQATGDAIHANSKAYVDKMLQSHKPGLVVQLEGRPLLDHYPDTVDYYHVSEDAVVEAHGYTVEAEQAFMPFPDQSVELLLVAHALELYQNMPALCCEFERVLAPKGSIIVTTLVSSWIGGSIPATYHPLGGLKVAPRTLRRIKLCLARAGLEVVSEFSLMSDPNAVMMGDRVRETIVSPIGLEVVRAKPVWSGMVGVAK